MTVGRELKAKLLLEGMEVPLIGATVTSTVGVAAIAYVDVVPHQTINNIKPRTLVHIEVRDFNNPDAGFPFIHMFEGEVFGFAFSKTPNSRMMTLSCIDYTSYWDNALIYFFNPMQSLAKGAEDFAAIGMTQADIDKMGGVQQVVSHSISSYYLKVIESAGGDFLNGLTQILKDIAKINEFYKLAEQRVRIVDRIIVKSSGKLNELLKATEAREWFEGIVGRNTGYQTLRMVVQDMMSLVFHDGVSVTFPSGVAPQSFTGRGITGGKTIGSYLFKPNLFMMVPPVCNIFYPDEYSRYNYNRNFFQEPTRLIYQPELPVYGNGQTVKLKHAYAPDCFAYFMGGYGKGAPMPAKFIGKGSLQVDSDRFGHFGDDDPGNEPTNNKKKEQQFLTNEERMKGFLLSNETMVPASSQFRGSIEDQANLKLVRLIANYLFYKKRFQGRELQITAHLKPSVVPGFTVLVLDDSDAEQSLIAYCNSVTHRIYATQGGYTNVQLSYARQVDEQDITSEDGNSPLVPPWFADELRGTIVNGEQQVTSDALSDFYQVLLGSKGSKNICGYAKVQTATKALEFIKKEYQEAKTRSKEAVSTLIRTVTGRDYVTMDDAFLYLSATTSTKDHNTKYMEYTGIKNTNMDDVKKDVVKTYRDTLKTSTRGFRG
jgi:hypothetical protein